jgi:hypothetical protein
MLFFESSANKAKGLNVPDFKVSSKYYHCEQNPKWVFGDSDEYFYPSYEVNKKPTKNDN